MKSPIVMESGFSSPIVALQPSEPGSPDQNLIVGRRGIQRGLLARAALYSEQAAKGNTTANRFNGIPLSKRDPIVWGDASNRYMAKHAEVNNNNVHVANESYTRTEVIRNESSSSSNVNALWQNGVTLTSSPIVENRIQTFQSNEVTEINLSGTDEFSKPADYNGNAIDDGGVDSVSETPNSTGVKRLSFNTTQQLRTGFFRSIKRQYSPILSPKSEEVTNRAYSNLSSDTDSCSVSGQSTEHTTNDCNDGSDTESRDSFSGGGDMSKFARRKLEQLRKRGPNNVDVSTGLQWIRLELHEMREQDKSLFLQLIKLHSTIKELRSDFTGSQDFDSYDDLHSAASLWWPRRGYSTNVPPDFSSSDGAQMLKNHRRKPPLRRGFSVNYPPTASRMQTNPGFMHQGLMRDESMESVNSRLSVESTSTSIRTTTAC